MSNYKLSIVAAVYNLEKYLPRCLDALVNQTLQEIEILCVDDGSTDSAPQIIDEYAKKYPAKANKINICLRKDCEKVTDTREEMIEKIKMETRRYAKRQLTWFRKIPNIIWIDGLGNVQDNVNLILQEAELNEN